MTPRDLDRIEATFAAIFARLEELEHGQEDHHARIAAMEAKPSTTGPPINEAGITATFAATMIGVRLREHDSELEKVAVQMAAQEIRLATLDAASKHASDYAVALSARLERLESAFR